MTLRSTFTLAVPPTRRNSLRSRTRRSFAWVERSISAISSRKSVPPSASSKSPFLRSFAPVKAPLLVPEELVLEDVAPERGAVERHEQVLAPRAALRAARAR